jgi:cell division protein FtsI/penicillin-binding protein 2
VALRQRRIGWLLAVFALFLAVAAGRALQLATLSSGTLSSVAASEHNATVTIAAPRGSILDRDGVVLALTQPAYDITAAPNKISNPAAFALELAPVLHVPAKTIENAIAHPTSSRYYTIIARQVPATTADQLKTLGLPSLAMSPDPVRHYPDEHGYLAAQLLGGVAADGEGISGIEEEFNRQLAGVPGVQQVVYDGKGRPVHIGGSTAVAGQSVQLTISAALQQYADSVVDATGKEFKAQDATAIVLNPQTGDVLAMSNWPRANANDPAKVGASENYAVGLDYEPGSTFKVVSIGGALSDGLIAPTTQFTIPPCIQVANYCITDSEAHGTETMNVNQILSRSSNIGAIKIGKLLGPAGVYRWVKRFGFGNPTGIDLPFEERGTVPPTQNWSGSTIGNIPIGQGLDVTPLQVAEAYAAIANGGILRAPRIVEKVGNATVHEAHGTRILTPAVSAELRRMLEGVTREGGTAAEITIPGYVLAGKTGTANKVVDHVYSHTDYYASFVGFAPAHDPKVEAIVVVDSPQTGQIYGTEVAAPAWQKIMEFALQYLGIPPN